MTAASQGAARPPTGSRPPVGNALGDTMLDLVLKAIDRLIDLLERGKKSKRAIFTDHIEPVFSDLLLIHTDLPDIVFRFVRQWERTNTQ